MTKFVHLFLQCKLAVKNYTKQTLTSVRVFVHWSGQSLSTFTLTFFAPLPGPSFSTATVVVSHARASMATGWLAQSCGKHVIMLMTSHSLHDISTTTVVVSYARASMGTGWLAQSCGKYGRVLMTSHNLNDVSTAMAVACTYRHGNRLAGTEKNTSQC